MKFSCTLAVLAILSLCVPASAQVNTAKRMMATLPKAGPVQRDAAAEQAFLDRHAQISTQLTATARAKLDAPAKTLAEQFAKNPLQSDAPKYVRLDVARLFPGATAEQLDVMTFYVLAEVLKRSPPPQAEKEDQGAGLNEIAEFNDQRVQQSMDRRSKFAATLSNLMKKIETTQDRVVQNMK